MSMARRYKSLLALAGPCCKFVGAFYEILRGMAGLEEREGIDSVAMREIK